MSLVAQCRGRVLSGHERECLDELEKESSEKKVAANLKILIEIIFSYLIDGSKSAFLKSPESQCEDRIDNRILTSPKAAKSIDFAAANKSTKNTVMIWEDLKGWKG